jgi:hypothetical protein
MSLLKLFLTLVGCLTLSGCAQTGYQPFYIISQEKAAEEIQVEKDLR